MVHHGGTERTEKILKKDAFLRALRASVVSKNEYEPLRQF